MHLTDMDSLQKVFNSFDVDKNGTIDKGELEAALKKANKNPTKKQVTAEPRPRPRRPSLPASARRPRRPSQPASASPLRSTSC